MHFIFLIPSLSWIQIDPLENHDSRKLHCTTTQQLNYLKCISLAMEYEQNQELFKGTSLWNKQNIRNLILEGRWKPCIQLCLPPKMGGKRKIMCRINTFSKMRFQGFHLQYLSNFYFIARARTNKLKKDRLTKRTHDDHFMCPQTVRGRATSHAAKRSS